MTITIEPQIQKRQQAVVQAYNEWDPLEEVIVGVVEGAVVPEFDDCVKASVPKRQEYFYRTQFGQSFPEDIILKASEELDGLVRIFKEAGVKVVRPKKVVNDKPYSAPHWTCTNGMYQAMPRDLLIVIGDEIIESPLAWRSRHYEINAYREILKDILKRGGKWSAAPRPELPDELYEHDYIETCSGANPEFAINEYEPTFDAADFIRCGRDIFAQRSNVTNEMGIRWLEKHIGPDYRVHRLQFNDSHPMHIDGSFMPLAPGQLLVNPLRVNEIPEIFRNWNVMYAPESTLPKDYPLYMTSSWISMNVVMIDEKRVVVEKNETPTIRLLEQNGFEVIVCEFRNFYSFGGGFHCATCDIRRNGSLQVYF